MKYWRTWIATGIIMIVFGLAYCANAAECPPGVPKCKVLVISPEMEQALVGPNMILDTAEWGNRVGLAGAAAFFRKLIADAPISTSTAPAKVEDPPKPQ
jgi:hypothetical protein